MPDSHDLLRTIPVQPRARRTLEHLLSTAADLLDEVGVDAFNTNLLAERAGVRVRTVYRYFPDKHTIVLCLAERAYERADESLRRTLAVLADPDEPWRPAVDEVLDDYFETMGATPGWAAIRRAVQAIPGLDETRKETVARHADWLARAFIDRGLDLPPDHVRIIAATAFAAGSAILTAALQDDAGRREASPRGRREAVRDELKKMLRAYLAEYLD